ncbi:MAG: thioredoxin [Lachnospiraceae bacterium]|nr:thioredoxin [Lachnospiraceae bacterium]MBR1568349.1 thioredoxin [Lachnospiraceae bacterium]
MAVVHIHGTEEFEKEVLQADQKVLVDFWATWCGPCQMVGPIVEELSNEMEDVKVVKVEVDENPDLARQYRVMSIPMLAVFKGGELAKKQVGALQKPDLQKFIEEA